MFQLSLTYDTGLPLFCNKQIQGLFKDSSTVQYTFSGPYKDQVFLNAEVHNSEIF